MSRRIRSIKPEVLEDEVAVGLGDRAWRLWVSSWVLADDYGNLRAHDRYLAANVWQDTSAEVEASRNELISTGRWVPYAVRGQRYVHIRGWEKHQRITNAGKQLIPGPEADDGSWNGLNGPPTSNQALAAFFDHSRGEHSAPRGETCDPRGEHSLSRDEQLSARSDSPRELKSSPLRASPARAVRPPEQDPDLDPDLDLDPEGDPDPRARERATIGSGTRSAPPPPATSSPPDETNADSGAEKAPRNADHLPDVPRQPPAPKTASEGHSRGNRFPAGQTLTPPPDDIELTQSLKDECVMNGWPEPTKDHVQAFLLNARSKGQMFADWTARFKWWMAEEKKRMGRRPMTGDRPPSSPSQPERKPKTLKPMPIEPEPTPEQQAELIEYLKANPIRLPGGV